MTNETELRRRIETLIIGKTAPVAARAIIDALGLTVESGDGQVSPYGDGPITLDGMSRVVGRWEKQ